MEMTGRNIGTKLHYQFKSAPLTQATATRLGGTSETGQDPATELQMEEQMLTPTTYADGTDGTAKSAYRCRS